MRRTCSSSSGRTPRLLLRAYALGLSVAAALSLGCAADLPDGIFSCEEGGSCPAGWRCFPNDRCYSPSFVGLPPYAACDVDEDCESALCLRAFDASASLGRCSVTCANTAGCPLVEDVEGVCAPGVGCIAECDEPDDCSAEQSCVVAPGTQGETGCAEFVSLDFSGIESCMGPLDCPAGNICMRAMALDLTGVCVWPCNPGGGCPTGATCEVIPGPIASVGANPDHACLATCNGTPGSCGASLACGSFPAGNLHCVPPGWLP